MKFKKGDLVKFSGGTDSTLLLVQDSYRKKAWEQVKYLGEFVDAVIVNNLTYTSQDFELVTSILREE